MKLALLDRDGVINEDRIDSVKLKDDFVLLPQVVPAIKMLNEASIPIAIVTNQAAVGRGEISEEKLLSIHAYLENLLKTEGAFIQRIYVALSQDPSHPDRKPNSGLLLKALQDFQVCPEETFMIGDDLRDLEAAASLGCHRILVRTGKGKATLEKGLPTSVLPVNVFKNLYEAVTFLLNESL